MIPHLFSSVLLLFFACSNAPEQKTSTGIAVKQALESSAATVEQPVRTVADENILIKIAPKKQATQGKSATLVSKIPQADGGLRTADSMQMAKDTSEPMSLSVVVSLGNTVQLSHSGLDSLLQKYVSDAGKVQYKGLKADKAALDAYCQMLSENPVSEDWRREEKMAYWINAYNAFTLKLIVDNYPTKSIINFDGGKTWDVRRIRIGDKKYSLNNIENDILRPMFKDPRIHFAINCAAKSCPPIWNHAFTADNLEASLELRTRVFVNDAAYNTLSASRAQVSKIFDWYGVDFGNLREFLSKYAVTPLSSSAAIRFNEYNWDLNE